MTRNEWIRSLVMDAIVNDYEGMQIIRHEVAMWAFEPNEYVRSAEVSRAVLELTPVGLADAVSFGTLEPHVNAEHRREAEEIEDLAFYLPKARLAAYNDDTVAQGPAPSRRVNRGRRTVDGQLCTPCVVRMVP